jgi:quercetin dioxygenase-like cupin family protein
MLSRRRIFSGCALCGALAIAAGTASAQTPPAGIRRAVVRKHDLAGTNHETIQMTLELDPGIEVGFHTHPGIEASYVISGSVTLSVRGEAPEVITSGGSFMVPAGTVHAAKNGSGVSKIFITYIVEKGKPLASPA